jgi:hypothetical protein
MPDPSVSTGLQPPATPVDASPHAATVRAAHLTGSREMFMLPVTPRALRDQRGLEACVSCASAAAMEVRDRGAPVLSAMSHYHLARVETHLGNAQGRLTLEEGLATLQNAGICSQHLHDAPMTDAGLTVPLTPDARADARRNRLLRQGLFPPFEPIGSGSRVIGIRHHVKRQRPVLLGFRPPRAYPDRFLFGDHQWDDPSVELLPDGHCVVVIGFDDVRQALRVQDSRGNHPKFQEGCWWMGYAVADSPAILVAASVMVRP